MDIATIGGLILAVAAILVGQALEGGHASSLAQMTAALIVFGGTFGAVMVSFPMKDLKQGMKLFGMALKNKKDDNEVLIAQLIDLAGVARRDGVLALEQRLQTIEDPFLKRAVGFLVDGVDSAVARDALE